ncbi:MAG: PAC2 family protein [Candidatus Odinarchaeum yellowstonii]|uniref:PAC2 family protein n=1 Tax=Odinarchaeota yellowstonii (strain LCB_4) TaxID=1841599 RepID=A0AAF0D2E0_ODILC|nr:MAG: PAC2 family protein [Candidatus Odinarchaeum yellowstonii]
MDEFKIKQLLKVDSETLKNPIAIVGMPGIANVGKNVVLTCVEYLKAEKILEIFFPDFPAQVLVDANSTLSIPSATVYYYKGRDVERDLFFLTGDYQPSTTKGIYEFSERAAKIFYNFRVKLIIAAGAFMTNTQVLTPKIHVSATTPETLRLFLSYKDAVIMDYGTISGANGLIPVIAYKRFGIEGACLLADTNPLGMIDPLASKTIIELLNEVFNLNIDLKGLLAQIKNMEEILAEIKTQFAQRKPSEDLTRQSYIS